jgi:phage FluMu protein Com
MDRRPADLLRDATGKLRTPEPVYPVFCPGCGQLLYEASAQTVIRLYHRRCKTNAVITVERGEKVVE